MKNSRYNDLLHRHETYLIIITAIIFIFFSVLTGGVFISVSNITEMISGIAMPGIMAAGVLVVLISGGIDISFMAVGCVVQYAVAYYLLNSTGTNIFVVLIIAASIGIVLGLINGFLVWYTRVSAIIITIATMNIYFGLLIWVTKGKLMNNFPEWFAYKSNFTVNVMPVVLLIVIFVITAFILVKTRFGRYVFALGGNKTAAVRVGLSPLKIQLAAYAYLGLLASIGGLLQMYLSQTVAPKGLVGGEMEVLAMVVLGGASLLGGRGTAVGAFTGVILIGAIGNGIVLSGVSSYWFDFVTGLILLISFCVTRYALRDKARRGKGERLCAK